MRVNCEKTRTRRPCSSWVPSSSKNISYFAEPWTSRADSTRTRRGSQQTCRSFISASRIAMLEAAKPFLRMARRTSPWAATRMLS